MKKAVEQLKLELEQQSEQYVKAVRDATPETLYDLAPIARNRGKAEEAKRIAAELGIILIAEEAADNVDH